MNFFRCVVVFGCFGRNCFHRNSRCGRRRIALDMCVISFVFFHCQLDKLRALFDTSFVNISILAT